MIIQIDYIVDVYLGECEPFVSKYRWWHKVIATDGTEYYIIHSTELDIRPLQLLNIKRLPKSWITKYKGSWGLNYNDNYYVLVD